MAKQKRETEVVEYVESVPEVAGVEDLQPPGEEQPAVEEPVPVTCGCSHTVKANGYCTHGG
jgi:hypothetical protein